MKQIYMLAVLALTFGVSFAQSIFDNPITGTNPNTANPYTAGQTVNANITVSGIGRGAGITGTSANDRYNANSWNTAAIDLTAYFEFVITPNTTIGINFLSFVYTGQVSSANISNFVFRSSVDGFVSDLGTPTSTGATIDLSGPTFQSIASPITFRLYAWGAAAVAGNTFSVNSFTFNGLTGVLPITIEYLNGIKQNNSNVLSWKVNCTSSATAILSIERSKDGNIFNEVNNITATGLRCLQPFDYTDNSPLAGNNYYRLKMIDENGKTTYSNKIVLINKEKGFDITTLMPTIVISKALINASAAQKMQLNIVVTDFSGRQVQQNKYNLVAGSNQIEMNFTTLPVGAYQLSAFSADGLLKTIKFIKQ